MLPSRRRSRCEVKLTRGFAIAALLREGQDDLALGALLLLILPSVEKRHLGCIPQVCCRLEVRSACARSPKCAAAARLSARRGAVQQGDEAGAARAGPDPGHVGVQRAAACQYTTTVVCKSRRRGKPERARAALLRRACARGAVLRSGCISAKPQRGGGVEQRAVRRQAEEAAPRRVRDAPDGSARPVGGGAGGGL